jgi:hypothetical protein
MSELRLRLLDRDHNTTSNSQLIDYLLPWRKPSARVSGRSLKPDRVCASRMDRCRYSDLTALRRSFLFPLWERSPNRAVPRGCTSSSSKGGRGSRPSTFGAQVRRPELINPPPSPPCFFSVPLSLLPGCVPAAAASGAFGNPKGILQKLSSTSVHQGKVQPAYQFP